MNTRFGIRQTYRGEEGLTNAGLQFDRSMVNSSGTNANDTVTSLSANLNTDVGVVKNSFSGRYSLGEREGTGERAQLIGLNTAHSANLEDNLSLSGNASLIDNALRTGNGTGIVNDTRTRFFQLSGFGNWMPEFEDTDDLPLTLSGGLRYSSLSNEFSGDRAESQSMGGNLGALYRFSNNLTAGANAAVNQFSTAGSSSTLLTVLGGNVNYVGDLLMIGKFSYNWNVGGNANWQSASGAIPSNYFLGGQIGHSMGRFTIISEGETLSVSLSQNLGLNQNQSLGSSTTLSNSISASYGQRWGEQFSGTSTASVSDTLTTGISSQRYQMFSWGFNGTGQLSPLSYANVNLHFNWNAQSASNNDNGGTGIQNNGTNSNTQHMTVFGSASYTHSRFWGVRGLRYTMLFTADTRLRDERLLGNTNAEVDRSRWTLNNRFDYRLGLLDFRLNAAVNDVGGKKNALLFFQVTRQIGAY